MVGADPKRPVVPVVAPKPKPGVLVVVVPNPVGLDPKSDVLAAGWLPKTLPPLVPNPPSVVVVPKSDLFSAGWLPNMPVVPVVDPNSDGCAWVCPNKFVPCCGP